MTKEERETIIEMTRTGGWQLVSKWMQDKMDGLEAILLDRDDPLARSEYRGIKWLFNKIEKCVTNKEEL